MKIRTTPMRYAAAGPLTVIALTAASVSACGGSPQLGDPNGGNTVNVCRLVPPSQVAAITGGTVIQAIPEQVDSFPGPNTFNCTYTLSSGDVIQILLEATNSPDIFAANTTGLDSAGAIPITSVPGLGDKAVASINGLAVLTDKDNIEINGVPGEWSGDHAGDIKLARALISAVG
jgi:hypothetical protein